MVFIKELLPNPAGKDVAGEWLSLLNDSKEAVNLRGWSLKDASGKKFVFGSQTIFPNQDLKLPYSLTRINLNNDGDTVTLWSASGNLVDKLNYSQVGEGEIVSSSKLIPPATAQPSTGIPPLRAQAFTGKVITTKEVSPLLIALALALAFGIGAAILTKKLTNLE